MRRLRTGDFDVLVGINLLREGLGLPELALVAVAEPRIEGDVAVVIPGLEQEMQEAAESLEFERATLLRDRAEALRSGDFKNPAGTQRGSVSCAKRGRAAPTKRRQRSRWKSLNTG